MPSSPAYSHSQNTTTVCKLRQCLLQGAQEGWVMEPLRRAGGLNVSPLHTGPALLEVRAEQWSLSVVPGPEHQHEVEA